MTEIYIIDVPNKPPNKSPNGMLEHNEKKNSLAPHGHSTICLIFASLN